MRKPGNKRPNSSKIRPKINQHPPTNRPNINQKATKNRGLEGFGAGVEAYVAGLGDPRVIFGRFGGVLERFDAEF